MTVQADNDANTSPPGNGEENFRKAKRRIYKLDPTDVAIGNFHISMNKNMKNVDAISLLEHMLEIRNDTSLSSKEKTARVQELVNKTQV